MKNIIDICNSNISNSLCSLYEASILDIEGTIEAGTEYYEEAERELKFISKEISNSNNWKKYGIYCADWTINDVNALGKALGNNGSTFQIIIDKYDGIGYMIKFTLKPKNLLDSKIKNLIFARINLPLEKYSKIRKKTARSSAGPDISKIVKEFIKYFSDVETFREFLKKNKVKGYFYE